MRPPPLLRLLDDRDRAATPTLQWLDDAGAVRDGSVDDYLATPAAAAPALLIVPGERVSLFTVRLPGRQRKRWRQALAFALEERLAEPIEQVHLAAGERRFSDGETLTPVAAVARERLRSWLDATAALPLLAAVPDTLLLPRYDDAWSLLFDGRRCVLHGGVGFGFCADPETLPALLELAVARAEPAPQRLVVWGDAPTGLDIERLTPAVQRQPPAPALALHAQAYARSAGINLLQDEFAPRSPPGVAAGAAGARRWRFAAALAGVLLALQLVQRGVDYRQLERERDALQARIAATFRAALPDARLVDPRAQLAARLQQLNGDGGGGGGEFFRLLKVGGESLRTTADGAITLRGLRFGDGRLELLLQGSDLEDFDRLRQRLEQRADVRAELRTSKRDDTVESRLSLSSG